jgi:hypothetical protein
MQIHMRLFRRFGNIIITKSQNDQLSDIN